MFVNKRKGVGSAIDDFEWVSVVNNRYRHFWARRRAISRLTLRSRHSYERLWTTRHIDHSPHGMSAVDGNALTPVKPLSDKNNHTLRLYDEGRQQR